MALIEIHVPDIGDIDEVSVIELMVKPGDTVQVDQSLITVESDKASMEIPSSHAGVVKALKVALGDKVKQGSLVLLLEAAGASAASGAAAASATAAPVATASAPSAAPAAPAVAPVAEQKVAVAHVEPASAAPVSVATVVAQPAHEPGALALHLPHASPSVRKFARELGVPLAQVQGSGLKGRITVTDVQAFSRAVMSGAVAMSASATPTPTPAASGGAGLGLIPWPKVDFAKFGPIERKEMSRIKKISGANLLRNAILIPAVTNHDDADITDLEAFRVATNLENEKAAKAGGAVASKAVSR